MWDGRVWAYFGWIGYPQARIDVGEDAVPELDFGEPSLLGFADVAGGVGRVGVHAAKISASAGDRQRSAGGVRIAR